MDKEKIEKRLHELKTEFESGQKMLLDLQAKQSDLEQTLLRISGAMQVLEELLAEKNNGTVPDESEDADPS